MPLSPPATDDSPTPAQIGVGIAAKAYQTALMFRQHWLAAYQDWFGQEGWTVASLQEMTDGIDADSINRTGKRNAYDLLVAHHQQQLTLRAHLPLEIMADDPQTAAVPYTLAEDEHGQRIIWDAAARYPTEPDLGGDSGVADA